MDSWHYAKFKKMCIRDRALRIKKIPADVIAEGLEEIDEREYVEILSGLIEQKRS